MKLLSVQLTSPLPLPIPIVLRENDVCGIQLRDGRIIITIGATVYAMLPITATISAHIFEAPE